MTRRPALLAAVALLCAAGAGPAAQERPRRLFPPEELGVLAKQLAKAKDPSEAALLRERLTRGFYGI